MGTRRRRIPYPVILATAVLLSAALFVGLWRVDNKYNLPRPQAGMGVTHIDMDWYDSRPFFYLVEGWQLYENKLLTPPEADSHSPDAYLYIGQYGGFDLGNPDKSPHGAGTYRTVLLTDGTQREYALELTDIYSSWRLWVNGELLQAVGMEGEEASPQPDSRLVTFTATDRIDILVAVADDRGFYSGMVYPPAIGSPRAVGFVSALRQVAHGAVAVAAVLFGLLCLLVGAGISRQAAAGETRFPRMAGVYAAQALLCLLLAVGTAWPVLQLFGAGASGWSVLERLCVYGVYPVLVWIQYRLCGIPRKTAIPALALGSLVCVSVLIQSLLTPATAEPLFLYARFLGLWKWLCALWLLGTGLWALCKRRPHGGPLLAGNAVFATALVVSRLLPVHEPILGGWFTEYAGFLLLLIVAGILWRDTVEVFRESAGLRERERLAALQLEAREQHAALQREYVQATRERLHESRRELTLIRHYLTNRDLPALEEYLDSLLPDRRLDRSGQYTGNSLVDAILTLTLARAEDSDTYLETTLCPLPERLSIPDGEMTSLLMNLLDNALEACGRQEQPEERWIALTMERRDADLHIVCMNAVPPGEQPVNGTAKRDKLAHGYGLSIQRGIVERHGGEFRASREDDAFKTFIRLPVWQPEIAQV